MPATRVWYLLIDETKNVFGRPSYVDVPSDTMVEGLRKKIMEEKAPGRVWSCYASAISVNGFQRRSTKTHPTMSATRLWYLLIDHKSNVIGLPFRVDLPHGADVVVLLEKIKETRSQVFSNVDIATLSVWKLRDPPAVVSVSRAEDLERFLSTISQHLSRDEKSGSMTENETPARLLYYVDSISALGDWPENKLHIIAQLPVEYLEHKRKRDEEEFETDLCPSAVKLLKTQVSKAAPSSLAHPGRFRTIVGPGHAITCNRPFEYDTIPLVLLHEAFGIFKDRCEVAPSQGAFACLEELANVGCEWHATELARRSAIQSVLQRQLDLGLYEQKVPGTEFATDGNLVIIVMPAAIRECKNEHGDVLFQAILYYGNFLKKALEDPLCYYNCDTRFPSILIVDMGSFLGFYGAAWDGERVRVEPLTPIFDLSTHWRETKARHAIASSLDALVAAVRNIQAHYDAVKAEANALVPSKRYNPRLQKARRYPFLTSYDDNGVEMTFTYDAQPDTTKLVFSATLNQPNSNQCIVKFTRQYSEAAHNYLRSRGSAPTLRQCVQVSAEWTAVIMDKSRYQELYGLKLQEADQEKVRHKVKIEVQMLHNEGFVHGDIRDTNLLVDLGSLTSDDVAVHFIDFDWAGRIGEARYPLGINMVTVRRPEGVKPGELITKRHDEDMVSYLFR